MANNCLLTKLKGTVQNENLLKLGELKLRVNSETNFRCIIGNGSSVDFLDASGNVVQHYEGSWFDSTVDASVKIINIANKYTLNYLTIMAKPEGFSFKDIEYSRLNGLYVSGAWDVSMEQLNRLELLSEITITNNNLLTGDIGDLKNHPNAANITTVNFSNSNDYIAGDLDNFLAMPLLKNINLRWCTGITGKRSTINTLTARGGSCDFTGITVIEDA